MFFDRLTKYVCIQMQSKRYVSFFEEKIERKLKHSTQTPFSTHLEVGNSLNSNQRVTHIAYARSPGPIFVSICFDSASTFILSE